jgi:drug/metabolite transporter (DMT)-like permease
VLLGVTIMLIASAAYNIAPILLRTATRSLSQRAGLTLLEATLKRRAGLLGLGLELLGWSLEVVALTLLPLTLARGVGAVGLILLLALAHWDLREPLGWREILGAAAIIGGIIAVGVVAPPRSATPPSTLQWLLVLVVLGPFVLAPYLLRLEHRGAGALVSAVSAGVAYALSGLFTKGLSDQLHHLQFLPLFLVLGGAAIASVLGFMAELGALERGKASVVTPVYRALQTVIPIACAPLLFNEHWRSDLIGRSLLAGGILLTVVGIVLVSHHSQQRRTVSRLVAA